MALIVLIAAAFLLIGAGIFYLTIRMRDLKDALSELNGKIAVSDEVRRQASDALAHFGERIGSLGQKVQEITDVKNAVQGIRNLFLMPKGAGGAGERLLEKALADVLSSDMYRPQYGLSSGTVDFAIKLRDAIVPVDSKLSLENFNRMFAATDDNAKKAFWKAFANDVRKRIDETSKYILPGEKTTDFALMYIASESVYYEAFIKDRQFGDDNTLVDYAMRKRVYPTSPQTILPYLLTISQGMKALRIEENAKEILGKVSALRNDFERFRAIYSIIVNHIDDARKKHDNEAQAALTKLDQHISSLEHKI